MPGPDCCLQRISRKNEVPRSLELFSFCFVQALVHDRLSRMGRIAKPAGATEAEGIFRSQKNLNQIYVADVQQQKQKQARNGVFCLHGIIRQPCP